MLKKIWNATIAFLFILMLVVWVVSLSGCDSVIVSGKTLQGIQETCNKNGGINRTKFYNRSMRVNCNDGAVFYLDVQNVQ